MSKIYYTPFDNTVNAYTNRMKSILSVYGEVRRIDKKSFLSKIFTLNFKDVIVVNWLENMMIDKHGNINLVNVFKLFAIFLCFRMVFKKFIYVRHNHYPHSCNLQSAKKAKKILDFLEKLPHSTVVHSEVEVTESRKYIPHPLYTVASTTPVDANLKRFVIFGSISKYKKIENVINKFPNDLSLLIMGKCSDIDYLVELKMLIAQKNNVELLSEFVSDEKAQELINSSAGMLITHNDDDMIVSGSFFYAMSIHSRVYALSTPFFNWAQEILGEGYVKVYSDIDTMLCDLKKYQLISIKKMSNPNDLFSDMKIHECLADIIHD